MYYMTCIIKSQQLRKFCHNGKFAPEQEETKRQGKMFGNVEADMVTKGL